MAKPTKQPRKPQQERSHVRTRAVESAPASISEDGRSFDIIIYTETPVRTHVLDPRTDVYVEADEVLLAEGLDLSMSPRMPLVNNHNSFGDIRMTNLGRIDDVRVEDKKVVGRATLAHIHKDLAPDIAEGNIGNISATYYATDYEFQDRANDVPLAIAHKVFLLDGSMVPVGADPNASVRGNDPRAFPAPKLRSLTPTQETDMDELETAVVAAEEAIAALDVAIEAAGDEADAELLERARKIREIDPEELKPEDGEVRAEGDENLTEEEKKAEDEEIRSIRSLATTYGLGKEVDNLRKLGARASAIKAHIRGTVLKRGSASAAATPGGLKHAPQRSASVIDTRSIYERRNKR